jgi:hypothetical protein
MRMIASLAASYRHQELPARLMQRLAVMEHDALQAQAHATGEKPGLPQPRRAPRPGAQAIILGWFSLGVLASCAAGAGAAVGLRALATGVTPIAPMSWVRTPAMAQSLEPGEQWAVVQVAVDRSALARAPLGLQVVGGDNAPVDVVLEGVPAGVRPSRGEPVDPTTWVLKRAELDGLYLMIDEMASEAFDAKVGVLAPAGVATAGSIVQVRRLDAEPRRLASAGGLAASTREPDQGEAAAPDAGRSLALATATPIPAATARAEDKAGGGTLPRRPAAPTGAAKAKAPVTAAASWPEGASGLGAVPHGPKKQAWWWPSSWWAPASWSPFQVGQERP